MKKENGFIRWLSSYGAMILLVLCLLALAFAPLLRTNTNPTITFNITGSYKDIKLTNQSLAYLGFECIKECNWRFNDDHNKLILCYDQCQLLLKEVQCDGDLTEPRKNT